MPVSRPFSCYVRPGGRPSYPINVVHADRPGGRPVTVLTCNSLQSCFLLASDLCTISSNKFKKNSTIAFYLLSLHYVLMRHPSYQLASWTWATHNNGSNLQLKPYKNYVSYQFSSEDQNIRFGWDLEKKEEKNGLHTAIVNLTLIRSQGWKADINMAHRQMALQSL